MEYRRRALLGAGGTAIISGLAGCTGFLAEPEPSDATSVGEELTLATTTSTYDTGLLEEVNAAFEDRFGVRVMAIPDGTGSAIRTAENGDADVVLVHARELEDGFLEDGYGVNRRTVMFNDFVIVGPAVDPAGIEDIDDAAVAFDEIAASESAFFSRGDDSGTHVKELEIWREADAEPGERWYGELGQGMGETLIHASESDGYALADRGTYLAMRSNLDLEILLVGPIEGGPEILTNPYGIMAVDPAVHPDVSYDLAMAYIGFVTGPDGQEIIAEYTVDGQQLFYPKALSEEPDFDQYVPEGW